MEKNESFNGKRHIFSSGIPIFKLKKLNLFKSCLIKKKPSRNVFYDQKFLAKNNENTSILSDPSINILYKLEPNNKNKIEFKSQDISKENFLSKTNYYTENKKNFFDSFSQGSPIKNLSNISNNTNNSCKNIVKFPRLSMKIKKNYFEKLNTNKKVLNLEYKQRLKKINSSFSPDSFYSFEKQMYKDFSAKNIIYNNSIFSGNEATKEKNNTSKINNEKVRDIKIKKLKYNKSFVKEKINFNGKIFPNRKIYKFIVDPFPYGKTDETKDLSEHLKKMDRKIEKILSVDNNKIFSNNYSIVDKLKFKKEYQNPFVYDSKNYYEKEKEEYKDLINPEVYKGHSQLLKEMKEELNKIDKTNVIFNGSEEIQNKKIYRKGALLSKFKNFIIRLTRYLKQSRLTKNEIRNFKLVKQSFTYGLTKPLIDAIKSKNYDICCEIIEKHKYLVLDFDYYYLTPLHWAVKNNFYEFIPKLLDYGSLINFLNFSGDSPLHIAVKKNYYDSACILLYYLASPFIKDRDGKKPIEVANDFEMKSLLDRIMKIYYASFFQRTANQQKFIQNKFWIFINEEFRDKISDFIYNFIKNKEFYEL